MIVRPSRRTIGLMLLYGFQGQASATIEAEPADVFATITAIDRLPEWNARIAGVLEAPSTAALVPGTEWVVEMVVPPARWRSRARVVTATPAAATSSTSPRATT